MSKTLLIAAIALAGCAHNAESYRSATTGANEEQERAFAACRANATPLMGMGGLLGITAYHQSISDCMRAQGYVKQ
jgi:hypothetical protein